VLCKLDDSEVAFADGFYDPIFTDVLHRLGAPRSGRPCLPTASSTRRLSNRTQNSSTFTYASSHTVTYICSIIFKSHTHRHFYNPLKLQNLIAINWLKGKGSSEPIICSKPTLYSPSVFSHY